MSLVSEKFTIRYSLIWSHMCDYLTIVAKCDMAITEPLHHYHRRAYEIKDVQYHMLRYLKNKQTDKHANVVSTVPGAIRPSPMMIQSTAVSCLHVLNVEHTHSMVPLLCDQFSPKSSLKTPHSLPFRARYGVSFVDLNSWFLFYFSHCSIACNVMLCWTMLLRHSPVCLPM